MSLKSEQSLTVDFTTQNATSGAAADADSLPAGTLVINGTDNGATVTVTNKATGIYKAAVTLPSLTAGDLVQIRVAATVDSVAGVGVVFEDVADTKRVSDLNDIAAGALMGLADGAVTAAKFASNAITADKIADGALTAAKFASGAFDAVWSVATRSLTTFGSLVSDVATAVWAVATSALTSAGTIGKLLVDNINATIGSRSTQTSVDDIPNTAEFEARTLVAAAYFDPATDAVDLNADQSGVTIGTVTTNTDMRGTDGANTAAPLDAAGTRAAVGLASANLDTQLDAVPTRTEATADKDEILAVLGALNDPTTAAIASAIMASAVDGSITVADALKRIHAVTVGKANVTGTDPKVLAYRNAADDATVVTHSVPEAGTGRTVS